MSQGIPIAAVAISNPDLAKARRESLKRISKDWTSTGSSLESEEGAKRLRDLSHPPAMKKAMRKTGIALAVAPDPVTTVAGVALFAGSLAMKGEPATLKNVGEELKAQVSMLSALSKDLALSLE